MRFILGRWIDFVRPGASWIVGAAVLATAAVFAYTAGNLGIDTDTDAMISEKLPFRRAYQKYKKAFPQYSDTIVVMIEGATPERAHDASRLLAVRMGEMTDLFETVYVPCGEDFFEKNALLYLSLPKLEDLADHLAKGSRSRRSSARTRACGVFSLP